MPHRLLDISTAINNFFKQTARKDKRVYLLAAARKFKRVYLLAAPRKVRIVYLLAAARKVVKV